MKFIQYTNNNQQMWWLLMKMVIANIRGMCVFGEDTFSFNNILSQHTQDILMHLKILQFVDKIRLNFFTCITCTWMNSAIPWYKKKWKQKLGRNTRLGINVRYKSHYGICFLWCLSLPLDQWMIIKKHLWYESHLPLYIAV